MFRTYCRNIIRSFYDASVYREAIIGWQGFGGRHMLAVGVFVGLLMTVMAGVSFYTFNKYELPYILAQVPQVEIKDHTVTVVNGDDPTTIVSKDKKFTVLIDTKSSEADLQKKHAEIIVGKNAILLKQVDSYKTVPLDASQNYSINRHTIKDFFGKIYAFLILLWPLAAIGQALSMLGQVLIVALLSYAVTAAMREEYVFETRMRIATLAVTPPFIISKITGLFTENASAAAFTKTWLALLLALLYFYVMIVLIRRIDHAPTETA